MIKNDLIEAVKEFFITASLHMAVNCTLIILVPKIASAATIKEYRPTACCSVLYKIITKVLAFRLQKLIATYVNPSQALSLRKIADIIILANELVKPYSSKHISPSIIRIDPQKAYDSIEWVYLNQVIVALCFPIKFVQWIMETHLCCRLFYYDKW